MKCYSVQIYYSTKVDNGSCGKYTSTVVDTSAIDQSHSASANHAQSTDLATNEVALAVTTVHTHQESISPPMYARVSGPHPGPTIQQ